MTLKKCGHYPKLKSHGPISSGLWRLYLCVSLRNQNPGNGGFPYESLENQPGEANSEKQNGIQSALCGCLQTNGAKGDPEIRRFGWVHGLESFAFLLASEKKAQSG